MTCNHEWGGVVIPGPVNRIVIDQCESCGELRLPDADPPAQAADGCTESECARCRTHPDHRGEMEHAGISDFRQPVCRIIQNDAGQVAIEFCSGKTMLDHVGTTLYAASRVARKEPTFQANVSDWMDKCFLPSRYSNMTERGDRLLEEVLELLQAHGYDKRRIPKLVAYVFSRPVGDPAQEAGGVMVTLAGFCWWAGLDMHAAGDAELARIRQPEVMAKIRAKQEAKNALHIDTPLPGDAGAVEEWPREGDLVRYGDGPSSLAIRLDPHAGGWHGWQCCGGYTFFTKAYRPSRADMQTWLDCAKYRDDRTKAADVRVRQQMEQYDILMEAKP